MTGETTAPSQSGGSRPQASAQAAGSPVIEADTAGTPGSRAGQAGGRCRSALWGWSPPDLPADTPLKRRIDRLMPRTGWAAVLYFAAIFGLLNIAPHLPERANLAVDGLAALAAGAWCGVNLWRCRHAHCVVTSAGWLALSMLAFTEAVLGRSLIGGDEQPVFLAVLGAAILFEAVWYFVRGTNSVATRPGAGST